MAASENKAYREEYQAAEHATRRLGLWAGGMACNPLPIPDAALCGLEEELVENLPRFLLERNCIEIANNAIDFVCHRTRRDAMLTFGSVYVADHPTFPATMQDIERWLAHGLSDNLLNIHAWITMDSMQILDLTLLTTVARSASSCRDAEGGVIFDYPWNIAGIRYKPLVLGPRLLLALEARLLRSTTP